MNVQHLLFYDRLIEDSMLVGQFARIFGMKGRNSSDAIVVDFTLA